MTNDIPPAATMTIRQAYEEIYHPSLRQASPETIKKYHTVVSSWERFTENPPVASITNRTLIEYRDALLDAGLLPPTFNGYRSHLRAALRRLGPQEYGNPLGEGIIDRIPYVAKLREDRDIPRIASVAELNDLYRACGTVKAEGSIDSPHFWRTLIVVAFQTAVRFRDLIQLSHQQFDFEEMELRWKAGKTQKRQVIPLHPVTITHVQALDGDESRLFAKGGERKRIYRHWHDLQDAAGIEEHFGFQVMRRTAATHYERAVAGSARFIFGHAPQNVTDAYYINPSAIMRDAVEKLEIPEAFQAPLKLSSIREFDRADWEFTSGKAVYREVEIPLPARKLRCLYAIIISGGVAGVDELRAVAFDGVSDQHRNSSVKFAISHLRNRLRTKLDLPDKWDPLPWDERQNGWKISLP